MSDRGPGGGTGIDTEFVSDPAGAAIAALRERVIDASRRGQPLVIEGGNTKQVLCRAVRGEPLDVAGYHGILAYTPSELVITARAGTRLAEVEAALAARGQMLGFEPPRFGPAGTLGGAVAAGLSGPRRPYAGSVRDFVLGVRVMNGRGEVLRFGGQVMKNVAGYDVSRLMAGSHGTLGVLLDVSIRVVPRPECELGMCWGVPPQVALTRMVELARRPLALSGLAYEDGTLRARVAGNASAAEALVRSLAPDRLESDLDAWEALRDLPAQPLGAGLSLWRLSVPPASRPVELPGRWIWDWGGAQRWLVTDAPAAFVFETAKAVGGYAARLRGPEGPAIAPLPAAFERVQRALKLCFDPAGVFNPGRLSADA